jgi:hypothetical protein
VGVVIRFLAWLFRDHDVIGSPAGQLVLAAAAAALLAGVGAHIGLSRRRLALALWPLVLVPAAVGAACKLAWAGREARLHAVIADVDLRFEGLADELGWLLVGTSLAMILVPISGWALVRAARERALRWLATGATLSATAASVTACAYVWGFVGELEASANYGPGELRETILTLDDTLASGAWITASIGLIAAAVVVYRRACDGKAMFTNAGLVVALLVCIAGVAAFAATRDHAWDRQHPAQLSPPRWPGEHRLEPIAGMRLSSCTDLEIGPVLRIDGEGRVTLDSRLMSEPDQLAADLATLRRNWEILHPRDPFSGSIILWADPDTPLASVAPFLERALDAGYGQLFVQAYAAVPVSTRTLGVVQVRRSCPVRVDLTLEAAPLPETVEALVREIQDGRTTLALAP